MKMGEGLELILHNLSALDGVLCIEKRDFNLKSLLCFLSNDGYADQKLESRLKNSRTVPFIHWFSRQVGVDRAIITQNAPLTGWIHFIS